MAPRSVSCSLTSAPFLLIGCDGSGSTISVGAVSSRQGRDLILRPYLLGVDMMSLAPDGIADGGGDAILMAMKLIMRKPITKLTVNRRIMILSARLLWVSKH